MRLISLQLTDFRQFEGTTRIRFASNPDKNVTVIHGANGSGKTALLNALTWALYGEFTDAFENPQNIVNSRVQKAASTGQRLRARVVLEFEHNGRRYSLTKTRTIHKRGLDLYSDEGDLSELQSAGADGKWTTVQESDIADVIGRILPKNLHSYFFFDGERIERLQRADRRGEITAATTMLIGQEVLTRATRHLKAIAERFEGELGELVSEDQVQLLGQLAGLRLRLSDERAKLDQIERNIAGYSAAREKVTERLREHEGAKGLQVQRDYLEAEAQGLRQSLSQDRTRICDLVSSRGYQVYAQKAAETATNLIEGLRIRGELPSDVKAPFVKRLLSEGICICGRSLAPGEAPYFSVQEWLSKAGYSEVEESILRVEGEIDRIDREVDQFSKDLDRELAERKLHHDRLSEVESELERIRDELKGSVLPDVGKLQAELDDLNESVHQGEVDKALKNKEIRELEDEITEKEEEIAKAKAHGEDEALVKRRLKVTRQAVAIISEVQKRQGVHYRKDLESRINRIFSEVSFKPYIAVLNEDYTLSLCDGPNGSAVGASTGEKQILSLAFIAAIMEQAREFTANRDRLPGPESSTFPMVMDSPFGNLDPLYRRRIATCIPRLANQVVVLVTWSQWEKYVEQALVPLIGMEYVLTYSTTRSDVPPSTIAIGSAEYQLVRPSNTGYEHTAVQEVVR